MPQSEQSLGLSGQFQLREQLCCSIYGSVLICFLLISFDGVCGYGVMSSLAASFGDESMFCAIDASGKQHIACWGKNSSSPGTDATSGPSMAALSGGGGFLCGLLANTFRPFCWKNNETGTNLVPPNNQNRRYSNIASGKNHVCGIRSYLDENPGMMECWSMKNTTKQRSLDTSLRPPPNISLQSIVAGDDLTCGLDQEGMAFCWGSPSLQFSISAPSHYKFNSLVSGSNHVCGIVKITSEVKCWGDNSMNQGSPPERTRFIALTAGSNHSCGIRQDNHCVECWGSFNQSSIPKGVGFLAIASTDIVTCGIREENLVVDCWGSGSDYNPPLQLLSPGLCSREPCHSGEFFFNASDVGLPNLMSLCLQKEDQICSPCAESCPNGLFLSKLCSENADRICTECSLCQNSSCQAACGDGFHGPVSAFSPLNEQQQTNISEKKERHMDHLAILGVSLSCGLVLAFVGCFVLCLIIRRRRGQSECPFCIGQPDTENQPNLNVQTPSSGITTSWPTANDLIRMQAFRLTELRDATNGFKEFNELGRGSYGFVYKAVLPDGRQAAVKRANAARRIHSNSRDFEAELEIICKLRHSNLVNLLGYCEEMGERLLVYEFMPHGTLHDHLHGGLSPLSWTLRLKISMQAARGIEYLHKDASPPIIHKDIKASNILLDGEWGARVADFGLTVSGERGLPSPIQKGDAVYIDPDYYKSQNFTEKSDVYSFGVVLLEILSGRKAFDTDFDPPNIVEWAAPLISQGKAAVILDRSVDLPRNIEPLLRMADIAELSVRHDPNERPTMSDVAAWLEQLVRTS